MLFLTQFCEYDNQGRSQGVVQGVPDPLEIEICMEKTLEPSQKSKMYEKKNSTISYAPDDNNK